MSIAHRIHPLKCSCKCLPLKKGKSFLLSCRRLCRSKVNIAAIEIRPPTIASTLQGAVRSKFPTVTPAEYHAPANARPEFRPGL